MAPAQTPISVESTYSYSWISKLPAYIRSNIIQIMAKSLRWQSPTPTTRVQIWRRGSELGWEEWYEEKGITETQHCVKICRSPSQQQSLQLFPELCREARAAALGAEVFAVSFVRDVVDHYPDSWYSRFREICPQLPFFEGATRDLLLSDVPCIISLQEVFATLRHFFGNNIRRIHLVGPQWVFLTPAPLEWIRSTQTGHKYRCRLPGRPLDIAERVLEVVFHQIPRDFDDGHYGGPADGEFGEEDARVFQLNLARNLPKVHHLKQVCEVIRLHTDGRLMMNKGLKFGVKERESRPSPQTRDSFQQIVDIAKGEFPCLEYISICVEMLEGDPRLR